jgi:hypothetical protein
VLVLALGTLLSGCGAPADESSTESSEAVKTSGASACRGTAVSWARAVPGCTSVGDPYCDKVHAEFQAVESSCGPATLVETAEGIGWFYAPCPAGSFGILPGPVSAAEMACKLPVPSAPYTQMVTWQHMMSPVPGGCTLGRCPP